MNRAVGSLFSVNALSSFSHRRGGGRWGLRGNTEKLSEKIREAFLTVEPLTGKQEQEKRPQTSRPPAMCEKKRISPLLILSGHPHPNTLWAPKCQWLPEQVASEGRLKVPSQQQPCLALMYAELNVNPLLRCVFRACLLYTWCPPPSWLCDFLWRTVAGHWGSILDHLLIYQWHYWLTEHLFTFTHEYSINYCFFQGYKRKSISMNRRENFGISLSPSSSLPQSLHIYYLRINRNMQGFI